MSSRGPAWTAAPRPRSPFAAALVVVGAAVVGVLAYQSLAVSSSSSTSPVAAPPLESSPAPPSSAMERRPHRPRESVRGDAPGALGEADGVVPDGVTVFDDEFPAVAKLDPALLGALREAASDAASHGVTFYVDSGWRSPKYQQQLLDEAISEYGSADEAARWVATPATSEHVSGDAVDIGPSDATAWLSKHGAAYGLCQIYRNEPWHYELRGAAADRGCPPMYADPTDDPRMQP